MLALALVGCAERSVFPQEPDSKKVSGVSLDRMLVALAVGEKTVLAAGIAPSDAENKAVSWNSENPSVASVSAGGEVIALSAGETLVAVTTADGGHRATCRVSVESNGGGGGEPPEPPEPPDPPKKPDEPGTPVSGNAGPLDWVFGDGTLTLSGTGALPDYSPSVLAPWAGHCDKITTLVIGPNVTRIGDSAFAGCAALMNVFCEARTAPVLGENNFSAHRDVLWVPAGCSKSYFGTAWQQVFESIMEQ